jgi:acyl carrier protein
LLYESDLVDLNEFRFEDDIRKEYYIDSLDVTALVSSIEEEFNTIFDPDTYEKARSLDVIVEALMNDENIV